MAESKDVFDLQASLSLNISNFSKALDDAEKKLKNFGAGTAATGGGSNIIDKITPSDAETEKKGEGFGKKFLSGVGKAAATGGKILAGIATAAGAAVAGVAGGAVKMVQEVTKAYGNYEQLVGGVDKLFGTGGKSAEEYAQSIGNSVSQALDKYSRLQTAAYTVTKNAENAYKTAGMSANQYMETVTSISASLIKSVGGDTQKAANLADQTIRDMADNANTFGTSIQQVSNVYQSLARGNYQTLDNLKLGFAGTKTGAQDLIKKAEELDSSFKAHRDSTGKLTLDYGDLVNAIHIVQGSMQITGTTSREASKTIQGSMNSMKAAWQNFLTVLGDPDGDVDKATSAIIESFGNVINNMQPLIQNFINALPGALRGLVTAVGSILPDLLVVTKDLLTQVFTVLNEQGPQILPIISQIFSDAVSFIFQNAPMIMESMVTLLGQIGETILNNLPLVITSVIGLITSMAEKLADGDAIDKFIDATMKIIDALSDGLIQALPKLIPAIVKIINKISLGLTEHIDTIINAAIKIIAAIVWGLISAIPDLLVGVGKITSAFLREIAKLPVELVKSAQKWGGDLIKSFTDGLKKKWNDLKKGLTDTANLIKSFLHFSEPDVGPLSNFSTYAPDMIKTFADGLYANKSTLDKAFNDVLAAPASTLDGLTVNADGKTIGGMTGGMNAGPITINVYGAEGQNVRELAKAVSYEIQNMVNNRRLVNA